MVVLLAHLRLVDKVPWMRGDYAVFGAGCVAAEIVGAVEYIVAVAAEGSRPEDLAIEA